MAVKNTQEIIGAYLTKNYISGKIYFETIFLLRNLISKLEYKEESDFPKKNTLKILAFGGCFLSVKTLRDEIFEIW